MLLHRTLTLTLSIPHLKTLIPRNMSIQLKSHAFAGNPLHPLHPTPSPTSALETLKSLLSASPQDSSASSSSSFKVLAFRKGRPLARSLDPVSDSAPGWQLGWVAPSNFKELEADSFVYLGAGEGGAVYWAVDVSAAAGVALGRGEDGMCFVELRTLMVATDWADDGAMGELAVVGHAKALLEWHNTSRFCGYCGASTTPIEAGRRKQCTNESCKKKIYPRIDPVVIMLVIDKENDRVLLSRQSRFVPRMWSCLAGFIEPGESLEEAVKRETWEETGIEVDEVVYHSSQPWPVGPSSMPCQLMMGFFAYAKSLKICVNKKELEDAEWHSREDVKKALTFAEYEKAQKTAAFKLNQMCKGCRERSELLFRFCCGKWGAGAHVHSWPICYRSPSDLFMGSRRCN